MNQITQESLEEFAAVIRDLSDTAARIAQVEEAKAAPEQDHLLRPLFSDLEQNLKRLEHARKSSEKIINARLHEMNVIMARQQGRSYDNTGNLNTSAPVRTKFQNKYV